MKKILLISFISLFTGINVYAQRQKTTDNFLAEFEWNFIGDYTYHYVKQENGKELLDGPFSMTATENQKIDGYKYLYKATITGNYNLSGSHSKGTLHGPLTLNARLNCSATNGEKQNNTYTFRGNFKNGLPHGNFLVNYPSCGIKVNVNYKDGFLVGQYSVSGIDGLPYKKTGTLTNSGKPTGHWKFDNTSSVSEMTFLNGVVINDSEYDADLKAKAKAYALGTISEEKLMKENIFIKTDSMSLGSDAWELILHSGICFKKLGDYYFSQSKYVKYCYLDRLPFFSSEGFEKLKSCLVNQDAFDKANFEVYLTGSGERDNIYWEFYNGAIRFDSSVNMYFCKLHKSSVLADYCVGYPDWSNYYEDIYLTNEQIDELRKVLHDFRMEYIDKEPINKLYYSKLTNFITCPLDSNVVAYTYDSQSYPGLKYYSVDTFENYFINIGEGKELQKITPEVRKDIVNAKIKRREENLRDSVVQWFKDKVLNKTLEQSGYMFSNCNIDEDYFPIISYVADSIEIVNSYSIKVNSTVTIGEPDSYSVYSLIVFASINNNGTINVDISKTFDKSKFKLIKENLNKKSKRKNKMKGFLNRLEKVLDD